MTGVYSNVDTIWTTLGQYGRYQLRILLVTLFGALPMAFHVVSVVFIGTEPSHMCKDDVTTNMTYEEAINMSIYRNNSDVYLDCSIKVASNNSGFNTYEENQCNLGYLYSRPRYRSFVSEWDLICDKSLVATTSQLLVIAGMCVGAMATTLADMYGRKPVHIICNIGLFATSLGMSFVKSLTGFLVLRFLVGVFQQSMILTACIMWLELFPTGFMNSLCVLISVSWTTSVTLIVPIAYFLEDYGWRIIQLTLSLMSCISLIEYWLVDESLRWLIVKGKVKESKEIILKAAKQNRVSMTKLQSVMDVKDLELHVPDPICPDGEMDTGPFIEKDQGADVKQKGDHTTTAKMGVLRAWSEILRDRNLRLYSLVVIFTWVVNNVTYYGIVLMTPSLAGNIYINFLFGCVAELAANVILGFMLKYMGRRTMMITYMTITGACLIIAGILQTVNNETSKITVTVLMLLARGSISITFNLLFIYTPEVFPTYLRNAGIGASSSSGRLAGMVAPFSSLLFRLAPWSPGVIFGTLCVVVSVLFIFLPETKHRELPQTIDDVKAWSTNKN